MSDFRDAAVVVPGKVVQLRDRFAAGWFGAINSKRTPL